MKRARVTRHEYFEDLKSLMKALEDTAEICDRFVENVNYPRFVYLIFRACEDTSHLLLVHAASISKDLTYDNVSAVTWSSVELVV